MARARRREGDIADSVTTDLMTFAVGGRRCALPLADVRAVLPVPHLWAPPGKPAVVEGFFNHAGSAVPVVALDRLLGLNPSKGSGAGEADPLYRHLLVPRIDGAPTLALLVDRVEEVRAVDDASFMPVTETESLNGCVEFEAEIGGALVHVLNAGRILLAQERETLQSLYGMAQARMNEWSAQP